MNVAITNYEDQAISYSVKARVAPAIDRPKKSNQPTYGRRRGKNPTSFNGIHRRRNKRTAW